MYSFSIIVKRLVFRRHKTNVYLFVCLFVFFWGGVYGNNMHCGLQYLLLHVLLQVPKEIVIHQSSLVLLIIVFTWIVIETLLSKSHGPIFLTRVYHYSLKLNGLIKIIKSIMFSGSFVNKWSWLQIVVTIQWSANFN